MNWTLSTITIQIQKRDMVRPTTEQVVCIQNGIWAIHKTSVLKDFSVTHVPSGMLARHVKRLKDAKTLVDELSCLEWSEQPNKMPLFSQIEAAKPILAKY